MRKDRFREIQRQRQRKTFGQSDQAARDLIRVTSFRLRSRPDSLREGLPSLDDFLTQDHLADIRTTHKLGNVTLQAFNDGVVIRYLLPMILGATTEHAYIFPDKSQPEHHSVKLSSDELTIRQHVSSTLGVQDIASNSASRKGIYDEVHPRILRAELLSWDARNLPDVIDVISSTPLRDTAPLPVDFTIRSATPRL